MVLKTTDFTPFLKSVSRIIRNSWQTSFDQEGRPRWKALSPRYIAAVGKLKEARWGRRDVIGKLTGRMMKALVRQGGEHFEEIVNQLTLLIGSTSVEYLAFFDAEREILRLDPSDIGPIIQEMRSYIEGAMM